MNYLDRIARTLIFGSALSVFILGFLAAIIQGVQGYPNGERLYSLLSPICHQYPTRCIWVFGQPTALCARCEFGYLGVALAAVFSRIRARYFKRFAIGLSLLLCSIIDPIFQLLKYYESTNIIRALTGLTGGFSIFLILYPLTYRSQK